MTPVSPVLPSNPRSKEVEIVMGADQPEYLPLPSIRTNDDDGRVITSWKLTARERIRLLFTGRIYVQQLTFRNQLQPQLVAVDEPAVTIG